MIANKYIEDKILNLIKLLEEGEQNGFVENFDPKAHLEALRQSRV